MRVFGVFTSSEHFAGFEEIGETWESLKAAKAALQDRYNDGDWRRNAVTVVDIDDDGVARPGHTSKELFPCVKYDAYIDLYPAVREGNGWRVAAKPSEFLTLGPRGGIQRKNY